MLEFRECIAEVSKRFYDEHSKEKVLAEPIIFSTFAKGPVPFLINNESSINYPSLARRHIILVFRF